MLMYKQISGGTDSSLHQKEGGKLSETVQSQIEFANLEEEIADILSQEETFDCEGFKEKLCNFRDKILYLIESNLSIETNTDNDKVKKVTINFETYFNKFLNSFVRIIEKAKERSREIGEPNEHLIKRFLGDLKYLTFLCIYSAYRISKDHIEDQDTQENSFFANVFHSLGSEYVELYERIKKNHKAHAFLVPARAEFTSEGIGIINLVQYLDTNDPEQADLLKQLISNLPPLLIAEYELPIGDGTIKSGFLVHIPLPHDIFPLLDRLNSKEIKYIDRIKIIIEILLRGYKDIFFSGIPFNENDIKTLRNLHNNLSDIPLILKIKLNLAIGSMLVFSKNIRKKIQEYVRYKVKEAIEVFGLYDSAIGAGAILPAILNRSGINEEFPNITNGHRITILLMIASIEKAILLKYPQYSSLEEYFRGENNYLGIIGCGYIGETIVDYFVNKYPNARFVIYDIKRKKSKNLQRKYPNRIIIGEDPDEVLSKCLITAAAPSGKISLRENHKGRIVVDDSEPSSLPSDWETRGIIPIKPLSGNIDLSTIRAGINEDGPLGPLMKLVTSEGKQQEEPNKLPNTADIARRPLNDDPVKPVNKYKYGVPVDANGNPGLLGPAMFGCELEALILSILGRLFAHFERVKWKDILNIPKIVSALVMGSVDPRQFQYMGIYTGRRLYHGQNSLEQ